jgi:hypothetical protein
MTEDQFDQSACEDRLRRKRKLEERVRMKSV